MIVAEPKPIEEVYQFLSGAKKVLVAGCGSCVTVCMAGGEKEVGVTASALRMMAKKEGRNLETVEVTLTRQCDPEYMDELATYLTPDIDAVLSLACGVGVQYVAERFPLRVYPALNTKFAGGSLDIGYWQERCGLCGECILYKTGGICPVVRCAKNLLNGPCGGSQNGKCEISTPENEIDCAWQLIYDRLKLLGELDRLMEVEPPKDWSKAKSGGLRHMIREDVRL